ncbi:MAG TPA: GntR family transcriptional regulator [Desulfovibrio sp.]|nr:GntR family transcriptional regulator [Desulfovibrio sp.]
MWLPLDVDGPLSLGRQLYERLKQMILDGELAAGARLPSSRALAVELGVSRNTVLDAYDQLSAEGYLETRHGSGTKVAAGIVSERGEGGANRAPFAIAPAAVPERPSGVVSFRSGIPALDVFPREEWARTYQRVCAALPDDALRYSAPAGVWALREAIAGYLRRTRGIRCHAERVMITSGATQGLRIMSRLLQRSGGVVLAEDPAHAGLREVLEVTGLRVEGVPVDDRGMDTGMLPSAEETRRAGVAFVYVTPSHQYPLGGILPVQRRQALVRFAREAECLIVEDDYDGEFRHEGSPVGTLHELAPESVVYLGSFSKVLAPALRLGFAILPARLLAAWHREKLYSDVHTDALSQHALASFIGSGALERHIWRMKKLYRRRRAFLVKSLMRHFGDAVGIRGHATGLHLVAAFTGVRFDDTVMSELARGGVEATPVHAYALQHGDDHVNELILGYAHLSEEAMEQGVRLLKQVLGNAGRVPVG